MADLRGIGNGPWPADQHLLDDRLEHVHHPRYVVAILAVQDGSRMETRLISGEQGPDPFTCAASGSGSTTTTKATSTTLSTSTKTSTTATSTTTTASCAAAQVSCISFVTPPPNTPLPGFGLETQNALKCTRTFVVRLTGGLTISARSGLSAEVPDTPDAPRVPPGIPVSTPTTITPSASNGRKAGGRARLRLGTRHAGGWRADARLPSPHYAITNGSKVLPRPCMWLSRSCFTCIYLPIGLCIPRIGPPTFALSRNLALVGT